MNQNTVSARYRRAFDILQKLPLMLLGLCILTPVLAGYTAGAVVTWILPIIALPVGLTLGAGLCGVFLKVVRDEHYDLMTLFEVFSDLNTLKRVAGGMCWMTLLVYLWSVIPATVITIILAIFTAIFSAVFETRFFAIIFVIFMIILWIAAMVMAVIKALEFAFTPYILVTRPDVKATEAVKESARLTKGLRGSLFVAQLIPVAIYTLAVVVLSVLTLLPFIGWLFGVLLVLVEIAFAILYTLFAGLVHAGFYNEAQKAQQEISL